MLIFRIMFTLIAFITIVSCSRFTKEKTIGEKELEVPIKNSIQAERSVYFFGQNYWRWPIKWGNDVKGTENIIRPLGIKFLRFGGENNDTEIPERIDKRNLKEFFNYCKSIGAEPLLQLSVISGASVKDRIKKALQILEISLELYPSLTYIEIGNEPDIYSNYTSKKYYTPDFKYFSRYKAGDYINDFTNISAAIKTEYPQLKVMGPALSYKYFADEDAGKLVETGLPELKNYYLSMTNSGEEYDWLSPFVKECAGYVDIVSVHAYPVPFVFLCSYVNARDNFDQVDLCLNLLRNKIERNSGSSLPLAFTEMDITADGGPAKGTSEASLGTFNAALWMADFFGIASGKKDVFSVMPWSICEEWNQSFLNYRTRSPKPAYFVYRIFSEHSRKYSILAKKFGDVRIYAGRDENGGVSVFVVNWDKQNRYHLNLNFSGLLNDSVLNYTVEPWSLTCLTAEPGLTNRKCYVYKGDNAIKGYTEGEW